MDKEKILIGEYTFEFDRIRTQGKNLLKIVLDEAVNVADVIAHAQSADTITLLTRGDTECGSFSGYKTLCKQEDDHTIILSNDESVWVEPEPEPDPTDPEYVYTLEELKLMKISELSSTCRAMIYAGVDVDIDGELERFSYTLEDQSNIKAMFDLSVSTGLAVPWHSNGANCKLYTTDQIVSIYVAENMNLTHHETYFNQLRTYVNTLETEDEVRAVEYGQELTGEYLDTYNMIMAQANELIYAVTGGGNNDIVMK